MISAVVLTKNEENNVVDCLESLLWCDEIIVIDDESEDRTVDIIKSLNNPKIKLYKRPLSADFSAQRNFGLQKAKDDWVMFIDADERVTKDLKNEIENMISSQFSLEQKLRGFYIRRTDVIWSKKLRFGETGNIMILRLARKGSSQWVGKVHEVLRVKGKIGQLRNPIFHYPHQDVASFLKEINFYTDIRAKELFDKKVKVNFWSIIIHPLGKFLFNYAARLGFLDGMPGFVFAIFMTFHSFLVRGKLWLLWKHQR